MNSTLAEQLVNVALETIDSVSEVVLTVVLAVYLLLDGERLWNGAFCLSALAYGAAVSPAELSNYFLGQVAFSFVGLSMTLAFLALRVPFGFSLA